MTIEERARVLMCPPDHFDVTYAINPWMNADVAVDCELAAAQWRHLADTLKQAGATVEVLPPVAGLPDLVFTANVGLVSGSTYLPARMRYEERRPEAEHATRWMRDAGFEVGDLPASVFQEGAGDALRFGRALVGGYGPRSTPDACPEAARLFGRESVAIHLVDPRLYHIDLVFCPLDERHALIAPSGLDAEGLDALRRLVPDCFELTVEEAYAFCANSLVVGRTGVMPACPPRVEQWLRERGFEPVVVDVSEFLKAGGGPRCLTLDLHEPAAARSVAADETTSLVATSFDAPVAVAEDARLGLETHPASASLVAFMDVSAVIRWLNDAGIEPTIERLLDRLEGTFRRWTDFERSARLASHSPVGVIELMPTSDDRTYSFKYVNGHPSNPDSGLQTVTAFGVLADVVSGYPTFWAEMTILTALRTAATSALAAKYLARSNSSTMGMIGTGSQAEFQALAMRRCLGIDRLQVWDTDPKAVEKFCGNMVPLGFDVTVASDAREATLGVDVITTCIAEKAHAGVLDRSMVAPGTFINAIGGDCPGKTELKVDVLRDAAVFVEFEPQTRVEGEIQQVEPDFPVTELWEVIEGKRLGRTSDDQITIFDSVGFAIEDFAALRFLQEATRGTEYPQHVELIAEPTDPKNLFGLVRSREAVMAR